MQSEFLNSPSSSSEQYAFKPPSKIDDRANPNVRAISRDSLAGLDDEPSAGMTIYTIEEAGVFLSYFKRRGSQAGFKSGLTLELLKRASRPRAIAVWLEIDQASSTRERLAERGFRRMAYFHDAQERPNLIEWWKLDTDQAHRLAI